MEDATELRMHGLPSQPIRARYGITWCLCLLDWQDQNKQRHVVDKIVSNGQMDVLTKCYIVTKMSSPFPSGQKFRHGYRRMSWIMSKTTTTPGHSVHGNARNPVSEEMSLWCLARQVTNPRIELRGKLEQSRVWTRNAHWLPPALGPSNAYARLTPIM